ncbi:MAG: hypothetical protein JSV88_18235 [Candidatus Aminicenantes bacterium]|nr:MAG: hypothetical protein JSV88_18235 [Candidatus Aminicenantes bacterium]
MNKKIRLLFLIVVFLVFIGSLVIFNDFQSPLDPKIVKISELKITKISGNGKIFFDKRPISTDGSEFSSANWMNIKQMHYSEPIYFKADAHAAFEFYYVATSFTVLPNSYLYYQPKAREFYFYTGEFYWENEVKGKKANVTIYIREPQNMLTLSDAGKIKIRENLVEIWNYSGLGSKSQSRDLTFNNGEQDFILNPHQLLVLRENKSPKISNVLPLPEKIDPEDQVITLERAEDSVVRFNWKNVPGAKQYIFRLYSSNLKENTLVEKSTSESWVNLDLLQFDERDFYWQVHPIDVEGSEPVEGVPSKMGHIQMIGSLMAKKEVQKPPDLAIKSLTVNGNLVIIKGSADSYAQLYINDDLVKIDMDGEFIHYLSFKTIGPKRIFFRLISPQGIETTEERYVTIFAE